MKKRILALTLSLALLLTACGASSSSEDSASSQSASGQTDSRIVRIAESGAPVIDPAVGSDSASVEAFVNLYDTLVFPGADGEAQPWVAESWDTSDDGLEWTFHLRQDVKFHSGNLLTAEDVAFSLQRLIDIGEGYAYLFSDRVASVTAQDDATLRITLSTPYGPFLSTLCRVYILEKALVEEHETDGPYGDNGDYGKEWLVTHDAGSGPYLTVEMAVQESFAAARFDGYWGGFDENAPDGFEIINQSEAATIRSMMANQELEISDAWQTEAAITALDAIDGISVNTYMTGYLMYMMLNTQGAPTDDIHFRKALTYCLDYDAIQDIFPGSAVPNGPVSSILAGWDESLPYLHQDLELAREELAQSQYADSLDSHPVTLYWVSDVPDEEKLALLLQSNAAEIGITVEVKSIPWTGFVDLVTSPESTPNITIVHVDPYYDEAGSVLESKYHSSSAGTWEQAEWLCSDEIDALIEDAISTTDYDERMAK
jgi:peptide/nickel transport system substrate-binding protein